MIGFLQSNTAELIKMTPFIKVSTRLKLSGLDRDWKIREMTEWLAEQPIKGGKSGGPGLVRAKK